MGTLKVLKHTYCASAAWMKWHKLGPDEEGDRKHLYRTFGVKLEDTTAPIFNRVGWYRQDGKSWYELTLPSGRMASVIDDSDMLSYELKVISAGQMNITTVQWQSIKDLVREKVIPAPVWMEYYQQHITIRRMTRDNGIHMMGMKKRIKAKIKAKLDGNQKD